MEVVYPDDWYLVACSRFSLFSGSGANRFINLGNFTAQALCCFNHVYRRGDCLQGKEFSSQIDLRHCFVIGGGAFELEIMKHDMCYGPTLMESRLAILIAKSV